MGASSRSECGVELLLLTFCAGCDTLVPEALPALFTGPLVGVPRAGDAFILLLSTEILISLLIMLILKLSVIHYLQMHDYVKMVLLIF